MTMHLARRPETAAPTRLFDRKQVEEICNGLEAEMETLIGLVQEETALVRSGKLFAAGELQEQKAECARRFVESFGAVQKMRSDLERVAPAAIDRLRRRHEEFRSMLQLNLAVLAAAREVSDNLIDAISAGLGKSHAPRGYGPAGAAEIGQGRARGLAVDQSL